MMLLPPCRTFVCLLLSVLTIARVSHCQDELVNASTPCYDNEDNPQRCQPYLETFSLHKLPVVNSTCGDPPNNYTFCRRTYSVTLQDIVPKEDDCNYVCDQDNPHGPELMTDFSDRMTWWQSANGSDLIVSIDIGLETLVQMRLALFNFFSLTPNGFYILKSSDYGESFQPFHYFAIDCLSKYMLTPSSNDLQLDITNETQVLCQEISNPGQSELTFDPILYRQSESVIGVSRNLHEFMTITNIRVILDGHNSVDNVPSITQYDYYYALEDLSIVGRCQCYGHAETCSAANGERECACEHNTAGSNCERCLDLYNDLEWKIATVAEPFECQKCECNDHSSVCFFDKTLFNELGRGGMCVNCTDNTEGHDCGQCQKYFYPNDQTMVSSPHYCQECGCYSDGTVDDGECQRFVNQSTALGQCNCKSNVMGRTCDECVEGYFNLTAENINGCQECGCNSDLSVNSSCDSITGVCSCRPNVMGSKCETCQAGYYLSDPSTCSPCDCDLGGSLSSICDVANGQCLCRSGVTGRTCREIDGDRYFPFIDHLTFEAEYSEDGVFDYSYRLPSQNQFFTGTGFVLVESNSGYINFGSFTPPINGEYEFVLRYRSINVTLWKEVDLQLTFDTAVVINEDPPSCSPEHIDPWQTLSYNNLSVAQVGAVSLSACLRKGRTYSINVSRVNSGDPDVTALEIDSVVVLFKEPENLKSLSTENKVKYDQCVIDFRNLMTRGSAVNSCRNVSFSIFTEIYNQTLDCNCDSVGSKSENCTEYGGQCPCKTQYNIGRQCDSCSAGSYMNPSDNDGCTKCSCSGNGSVDPFCNQMNGLCTCLQNVEGDSCDRCANNTFNFIPGKGCEECNCHAQGSNDLQCNENGTCLCNPGVTGDKCDICLPENFNFPICDNCSCNDAGSAGLSCTIGGQCSCRDNVNGLQCDTCSSGTFNLHSSNPDGCQPCYCSGLSSNCMSNTSFIVSEIGTVFTDNEHHGWTIMPPNSAQIHANGSIVFAANSAAVYLVSPNEYTGNQLNSYRQYLNVAVSGVNSANGGFSNGYDVLIEGGDNVLISNFTLLEPQVFGVRFIENSGWTNQQNRHQEVTSNILQSTLIDLVRLEIRVSLGDNIVLSSVSLDSAVIGGISDQEMVTWVEQCMCPANYTGLSCEQCSNGFTRNAFGSCVLCECNGYADSCDEDNGTCIGCTGNTMGDHCEVCEDGYYGDPINNIPCKQCECPFSGSISEGQYSPTCQLKKGTNDEFNCTECLDGHEGEKCESCMAGYYGDPLGLYGNSTKCVTCECNGNIDITNPNSCNKTTGICLLCLYNTMGDECELCADRYYGDAINAKNCTACECNNAGSMGGNCDSYGRCSCLPNVMGDKCTECASGHYNFVPGAGCETCDCDLVGSIDGMCDNITGQCLCKSNVTGKRCDQCAPQHYAMDENGCKYCGCSLASNGNCTDDGICSCNSPNVIGEKCDECVENFFFNSNTTDCIACPSCYNEIQSSVNSTEQFYYILHQMINMLPTLNDSTNTFKSKSDSAQTNVKNIESNVTMLQSEYGQLHTDVNVLFFLAQQLNITSEELRNLILLAEQRVSPYSKLAQSASIIVNQLKTEIYAGRSVLSNIETNIYPEVLDDTEYINDIAVQSNITLKNTQMHFETLENQMNNILLLVEQANAAASISLNTANASLIISNENEMSFSILQGLVDELDANISLALQELSVFNISVIYAQIDIKSIKMSLPSLPSEAYINSLINDTAELESWVTTMGEDYSQQLILFESLNVSLTSIEASYLTIQKLLDETSDTIDHYLTDLSDTLMKASAASSDAFADISRAEIILADLKNFSNATAALKAKADEALAMAEDIDKAIITVEQSILATMVELESFRNQLNELLPKSSILKSNSETLNEDSGNLANASMLLSEESDKLVNAANSNQASANQLYSDITSVNEEINEAYDDAQFTLDDLNGEEIQSLPDEAQYISSNVSEIVSNLQRDYQACPSVDDQLLVMVEEIVMKAENEINSTHVSHLYDMLSSLSQEQETELDSLITELDDIERRISRLKQIMASLPENCNENV